MPEILEAAGVAGMAEVAEVAEVAVELQLSEPRNFTLQSLKVHMFCVQAKIEHSTCVPRCFARTWLNDSPGPHQPFIYVCAVQSLDDAAPPDNNTLNPRHCTKMQTSGSMFTPKISRNRY